MGDQAILFDPPQVEALAARQHGDRHLADLGGGENELHMRRRLFQRFQQGVEGAGREHMHFVDDIDLEARLDGGKAHAIDDLADVVHAGAAGGVHFLDVDMPAFGNGRAIDADAAGLDRGAALAVGADAVQALGDDAGGGGLAHPAHAGQHEGMGQAAGGDGIGQGTDHRLLADQFGKGRGPVFPGQYAIGLGRGFRRNQMVRHRARLWPPQGARASRGRKKAPERAMAASAGVGDWTTTRIGFVTAASFRT